MKTFEFTYDGLKDMSAYEFSESYIKWINNYLKKNTCDIRNPNVPLVKIHFDKNKIIVDATESNPLTLLNVVMFIGYAFGQQDNGR